MGDEEKASDLYLLNKDMEIKLGLGEVNLQILEVYPQRIRTKCACLNNNNFIAFIAFPCKHVFCSGCVNEKTSKKCKNCGGEIEKMFQLVDINSI